MPLLLLHHSPRFSAAASASAFASCRFATPLSIRSTLPFPPDKARFHHHLSAAVDVAERACSLCVDVKKSLLSSTDRILEKSDQTPVTVADFGVQALISLELGRLFPDIPIVAEEDSASLRSSSVDSGGDSLVDYVVNAVVNKASVRDGMLTMNEVLGAIDRGGTDAATFDEKPATYWVLDPIDGTRGFLKGSDAILCKYMTVASGRASVFILRAKAQTVIKAWDHAVGVLCVHEAGGQVTDWRGSYLDLAADHMARRIIFPSGGVLVTNGHLHSQILEIISSNS